MRFSVPMSVTISGSIDVEADSKEDALKKARTQWNRGKNDPHYGLDCPCVDYDFCEDADEVEPLEGEDENE